MTWKKIFDKKNLDRLQTKLCEIDWHDKLQHLTVNEGFQLFHEMLQQQIDKHIPSKLVHCKIKNLEHWVTKGVLQCIRKQKKLYSNWAKDKSNSEKEQKYLNYRKILQRVKRQCKRDYYTLKCNEYRSNTKQLWKLINKCSGKLINKSGIIEYLTIDGLKKTESKIIAEEFAKFFTGIGKKFSNKINTPIKSAEHYLNKIRGSQSSLFLLPTNSVEIENIINALAPKHSCGHDGMSNRLLKDLGSSIVVPLEIIFNQSLSTGVFPDIMKLGDVIPLYKSKNKDNCTNYRPISLLLTISKVLEKIIYKQTYSFLDKNNLLYESQYGFKSKHSCENAITELTSEILKGTEKNKLTFSVFLDLSKAFDTLSHNLLLKKLEKYGIRGTANEWFKSYLSDRKLRSKCIIRGISDPVYSSYHDIEYGTPQGSCLGPLLFMIFVNDLHEQLQHCKCILFADDTTIFISHSSLKYMKWCIEEDLQAISDWFRANKLTLNISKSAGIILDLKGKSKVKAIDLQLEGKEIPIVNETKFLGVWIDKKLDWHSHTDKVLLKIKCNLNLLHRVKSFYLYIVKESFITHRSKVILHMHY